CRSQADSSRSTRSAGRPPAGWVEPSLSRVFARAPEDPGARRLTLPNMRWSPVHPRSRLFVLLLAAATGVLLSAQALAAVTPQQALERLMTEEIQPAWFAPAFLSQVPVAQVEAIVAQLTSLLGEYEGIVQENGQFLIVFSEGAVPAEIALDGQGRSEEHTSELPSRENLVCRL